MSSKLIPESIYPSWQPFLLKVLPILNHIENFLEDKSFNPSPENILRFLKTDLDNVKVIILGQDPYPQPGIAVGRAFEVGGLSSWSKPFPQISLKNILRNIYGAATGESPYLPFSYIRSKISDGSFPILPPNELFESWSRQGVLMLNTAFTCEVGKPGSHSELWRPFTDILIQYIDSKRPDCRWFLWGNNAISNKSLIKNGKIYASRHPMMCSKKWEDDFLKNPCFRDTAGEIEWTGKV